MEKTPEKKHFNRASVLAMAAMAALLGGCAATQKPQTEGPSALAAPSAAQQLPNVNSSTGQEDTEEDADYYKLLDVLDFQMKQVESNIGKVDDLLAKIDIDTISREIGDIVEDVLELAEANARSRGQLVSEHPEVICPIYAREDAIEELFGEIAAALDEAEGNLFVLKAILKESYRVIPPPEKAAAFKTSYVPTIEEFIAEAEPVIADLKADLDAKMTDAGAPLLPSRTNMARGLDYWNREACGEAE